MNKETRFIRECLCTYLGNKHPGRFLKLLQKIDFIKLNVLIGKQNLGGLIYYLYKQNHFTGMTIPKHIYDYWKKTAWKNTFTNSLNDSETADIAMEFDKQNIDYAYIKGAVCRKFYENSYIRSSVDIDFFINKNDYPLVKEILFSKNYDIPLDHYNSVGMELTFSEYEATAKEIAFIKKQNKTSYIFDIQWDFIGFDKTSLFHKIYDINNLFLKYNTAHLNLNGYEMKVLPSDKELYIMVFHYTFHHGFRGLKWLLDICKYITDSGMSLIHMVDGLSCDSKKLIGLSVMITNELTGKSKLSMQDKKLLCVDRLLPFEYLLYKSMIYRTHQGVMSSITHRLVKATLPYTYRNKLKAFSYMLFNSESITHRVGLDKSKHRLLHPFSLFKIVISDILRHKRKSDEEVN